MGEKANNNLLNHLVDIFIELDEKDENSLRNALAAEGLDYDQEVREGLMFISDLKRERRFKDARERNQEAIDLIDELHQDSYQGTVEELISTFIDLAETDKARTYFQKLKDLDKEDLKDILTEANVLKILEKEVDN